MRKINIFILLLLLFSINVYAWTPNGEVSYIKEIITYGSDSPTVLVRLESGIYCYLPNTDGENKKMYELLKDIKNFGKRGVFHCHDNKENPSGILANRIHRVISQ